MRGQPWGFEYRSCPATIFDCPDFARLALKAVKNLTECYINEQEFLLSGAAPQWTDYFNYCFFTPQEFIQWGSYINQYRDFMRNGSYERDTRLNWLTRDQSIEGTPELEANTPSVQRTSSIFAENEEEPINLMNEDNRPDVPDVLQDATLTATERTRTQREAAVDFRDDWAPDVRERFRIAISNNLIAGQRITLFGLAENRGDVTCGYNVEGFERIGGEWLGYGVPFVTRLAATGDERTEQLHRDSIAAEIARVNHDV